MIADRRVRATWSMELPADHPALTGLYLGLETTNVHQPALTAAHLGRTFDGKKIIAISHRSGAVWIFFDPELRHLHPDAPKGYSPPEGFHCRADGTWPTIELDVDPWEGVPLPERWVVQFGDGSTRTFKNERLAREYLYDSSTPGRRLVHLSAAGAEIVAP